ncbi:MAG: hypothetical protein IJO15_00530 [Clostridia bacterium]|nr:hypothetical protein [Clostridia bacterium]
MKKKNYCVRDVIPDTPDGFYDTVERSLAACEEKKERTWDGFRLPRKWMLPLVAALVLLIAGTAVAAGAWLWNNYSPTNYMETPKEQREEQGKTISDVEQAIASAAPQTGEYKIVMLPEFKNAAEQDEWRVKLGQPKYNEADWAWVREIRPEVEEVLIDGRNLAFNIRLNTDHAKAFTWPDVEGQWVDALVDNISFRREGESMAHPIIEGGGGINPSMVTDTGATLYTEVILDQPNVDFPTEGRVELTVEIGLRDARVDDMATVGIVGRIYYTFSFDAAAGTEAAPVKVTERPLSGSIVLTVDDWSDLDEPKLYNMRVSLDGVVLREEVRYQQTGIYVTYTVKEAPADWTEAMKNSLLYPNREAKWHGLYLEYRLGQEGEWTAVGHENHGNFGEQTGILPIFPSDYERVKQEGCALRLTEYYGTAFNGTPIDENWELAIGSGSMTLDFDLASQELMTLEIPLP